MVQVGFVTRDASACVFHHPQRRLRCAVYGDDATTCGPKGSLDWSKSKLGEPYGPAEGARLGPDKHDGKEGRVLNRVAH